MTDDVLNKTMVKVCNQISIALKTECIAADLLPSQAAYVLCVLLANHLSGGIDDIFNAAPLIKGTSETISDLFWVGITHRFKDTHKQDDDNPNCDDSKESQDDHQKV